MKRFLKPTGQLLTTAVFTSAALEPIAAAAQSVPQPPTPEEDHHSDMVPSEADQSVRIDAQAKTVVPPEASSSREFMEGSRRRVSRDSANETTELSQQIGRRSTAGNQSVPFRSVRAVTSLSHTQPSLPSPNDVRHDTEISPEGSSPRRLLISSPSPSAELLLAQAAPSLPTNAEERHAQAISQTPPMHSTSRSAASDPTASLSDSESDSDGKPENVQETQAWLDDTLARLVERDRAQREAQLRENLVDSAHQQLSSRNVAEARRLANNPVLNESERTDLMEAIADVEDRRFYPFVSAERAAAVTRPQPSEMPSQDWLMAQMNAYVDSNNAECVAGPVQNSGDEAHVGGQSQWTAMANHGANSVDEEFVSGGEFLAGIGHQAPSIYANKSDRSDRYQPRLNQSGMIQSGLIQSGGNQLDTESAGSSANLPSASDMEAIARAEGCPPTLGQHIGGVAFATMSGYEWMNQSAGQQNSWQMSFPLAVSAPITSRFGWRTHPIYGNRRFHHGVDFGAPTGTPVLAALPGRVQTSGSLSGYGLTIIIENEELQQRNLYAHMSRLAVPAGTWVEQGSVIGWVGSTGNSTGPHLHFEVQRRNGNTWTAVDPLQAAAQMLANRSRRE